MYRFLSLIIFINIYSYAATIEAPSQDAATSNNTAISGAINSIDNLNQTSKIIINQNSSITLLPNQNTKDILIKPSFDITSIFQTDSSKANNHLLFSKQITVSSGGSYTDYGSKFIGEGSALLNTDNQPAIKISGGNVKLYNSYIQSGSANLSANFNKSEPSIYLENGSLDIVGSTLVGLQQGSSFTTAINVRGFQYDMPTLNITGSNLITDSRSTAILANRNVTIDDTLWDSKLNGITNKPKKQGSHLVGGVNVLGNFTMKGILKEGESGFIAKDGSNLLRSTYQDPTSSNHTPFDSFIHGNSFLNGAVDIDSVYILGRIDFNEQADKKNISLNIKNSFITSDITNASNIVSTATKNASDFILDNVLADGLVANNYGNINSKNSYFNKNVKATKDGVSSLVDDGSVFKNGVIANNMSFTNSKLENGTYEADNATKATQITLNTAKAYKDASLISTILNTTNSTINSSLNINSISSTDSNINTKLGQNLTSVSINGGSVLGGFKTQSLNANNVIFLLGGTKSTYDGMMISTQSTTGSGNTLGILGVARVDGSGAITTNAINDNIPLAVLRGGSSDFFTQARFYHGISSFVAVDTNLICEKAKDINGNEYLVYVLTKDDDKDKSLKDIVFDGGNFSVESAIDGSLVNASGSLENENITTELTSKDPTSPLPPKPLPPKPTPPPTSPSKEQEKVSHELQLMVEGKNEKALKSVEVMSNQFYYLHTFEYNNLNKRMGELRNFGGNGGVWLRGYHSKANVYNTTLKSISTQLGVDRKIDFDFGVIYAGLMANIGETSSNSSSSIKNYGGGAYISVLWDNGSFLDIVGKLNSYNSKFKEDVFLGNLSSQSTGYITSVEIGHRFGNSVYIEPSAELILSYNPQTQLSNDYVNIISKEKLMLVFKPSVYVGYGFKNSYLRAGVGGIFDLNEPEKFSINDGFTSHTFDGISKDKRGFFALGYNQQFSKDLALSLDAESGVGGIMKLEYSVSATLRYGF